MTGSKREAIRGVPIDRGFDSPFPPTIFVSGKFKEKRGQIFLTSLFFRELTEVAEQRMEVLGWD